MNRPNERYEDPTPPTPLERSTHPGVFFPPTDKGRKQYRIADPFTRFPTRNYWFHFIPISFSKKPYS
jgi:hypothetical protein